MTQQLSWCAVAVSRAPFELMQLQQSASGVKVTSVRAGYGTVSAIAGAVRWAEEIMKAIDERWPTVRSDPALSRVDQSHG
jgi:hypothetical protein